MEYQIIMNLVDYTANQSSTFKTRNWVEINGESIGTYYVESDIKFKTSMIRWNLCDYSDAYIHVKATITVSITPENDEPVNNINKKVKNFVPLTNCLSEINYTQIDDAQNIDMVMPMYNLIK